MSWGMDSMGIDASNLGNRHEWTKTGEVRAEIRNGIEDAGLTDEMDTYRCRRCGAYGDTYLVGLGDEREDCGVCPVEPDGLGNAVRARLYE